jgi:DNA primase
VIVEGYTDVMAAHLAGVTTAVATCGTAFGSEHIKVIRRVLGDSTASLGEVIFTFDPDVAGQKAAMRAFADEQRFVAQTFVAVAPDGLDPCDLRKERGDEAVRALIDGKKPLFEFALRQVLAGFNLDTVEGRVSALRASVPVLAEIRDPAMRPGYVRELAGWLGVDPREVDAALRSGTAGPHRPSTGQGEASSAPAVGIAQLPIDPTTRLERDALMAMLQYPEAITVERFDQVVSSTFTNPTLAVVRDGMVAAAGSRTGGEWLGAIVAEVPEPFQTLVNELAMAPVPASNEKEISSYVDGVTAALVDRDLLRVKAEMMGRLQRTDPASQPDLYREIQRTLMGIEGNRRALRQN